MTPPVGNASVVAQSPPAAKGVEDRRLAILSAGLAGALGSLSAAAIASILGDWQAGILIAGVILILTLSAVILMVARARTETETGVPSLMREALGKYDQPLVVSNAVGALIWSNRSYLSLCGQGAPGPAQLMIGAGMTFDAMAGHLKAALAGETQTMTMTLDRAGERTWCNVSIVAMSGQLIWTFERTQELRLVEQAFDSARRVLETQFGEDGIGILAVDFERRVCFASAGSGKLFGRDAESLAGLIIPEEGQARPIAESDHWKDFREDLEARSLTLIEEPIDAPTGDAAIGSLLFLREEAEEGAADTPFDDGSVDLPRLFDDAPFAVVLLDADGKVQGFNKTVRRFVPRKALQDSPSIVHLVQEDMQDELRSRIKAAASGTTFATSIGLRFADRAGKMADAFMAPQHPGGDAAVILYMIDVTERENLQVQFVQAQKMQAVGQLAGGVAHDFNNLLTAIIGFCDLLLVRHGPGDQSFSDIMQVKQNANRAANLVRQLLAFSRQQTLRPKVLLVTDVLAEIYNLVRRLIGENIDLELNHGRDIGPVRVDQGQLEQVLINLAVNARDAMPSGGALTVSTRSVAAKDVVAEGHEVTMPETAYVCIEVKDTGTGIDPENLAKIFEPFFTTKEVGKGTGLGLSTVYGIVKQTGGFIFAKSKLGVGTTFQIYLPWHDTKDDEPVVVEPPEQPAKDLTGAGTILLVEDEDPVRMFASRALKNKGYEVLEAASGEAGFEIVTSYEGVIDLLISDVVMPNMDGPTLVTKARKVRPDMRIIFISGYAEDALRQNLDEQDYVLLPKPFSLKQLAEQVKDSLAEDV